MLTAFGQFCATADKEANLESIASMVQSAARQGCSLIVLPEVCMYFSQDGVEAWQRAAEPIEGRFGSELSRLAAKHSLTIIAGMTEDARRSDGRIYNAAPVFGPTGALLDVYRKIHLYDAFGFRESDYTAAGESRAVVVPVEDLKVGLMICYDLRFPELARLLVEDGADLIAVPAAWAPGPGKETHWRTLCMARAIENVSWVVACTQSGASGTGFSIAVDPAGVVAVTAPEVEFVGVVDISKARIAAARIANPSLSNRRIHARGLLNVNG